MTKTHRRVLITGPGGSGKTTLARYFQSRGKNAIDADLAEIGGWFDVHGTELEVPESQNALGINEWAEKNSLFWHWKRGALADLLSRFEEVYVMGSAKNAFELSSMFDRVFYLLADEDVILERLMKRAESGESYHDNGRTVEQREEIIRKLKPKRDEAIQKGFRLVDATRPPESIYEAIIDE